MVDKAASVLAKLKNKARATGISYQQCLQLFFQEEFLRRLAASPYAENFVLKGGLFIYTLTNFESRATVDVDFLMRGLNNDLARMDAILAEILSVETGNDFVAFRAEKAEPIALQRKYHGVSTQITGFIKNVRVPFNVDIMIWFSRKESDRRGWFMSDASIRSNLDLDRFYETEIPIPDEKVQCAIVEIYNAYIMRRNIVEQLKAQIKDICPILIRGSLEDGG